MKKKIFEKTLAVLLLICAVLLIGCNAEKEKENGTMIDEREFELSARWLRRI